MPTKRRATLRVKRPATAAGREWLHQLLHADRNMSPDEFFALYPPYAETGLAMATRPWWPPLSECWYSGEDPPLSWSGNREAWRAAWNFPLDAGGDE